jgi:hypothetical protein
MNPMNRFVTRLVVVVGVLTGASTVLIGQSVLRRPGALPEAPAVSGPAAISGLASGARHCVSGDVSNVHPIGWINQGTLYTVRFDAEGGDLVAAVGRMSLTGLNSTTYGTPEFNATASSPGTMALWVGGNGQAVCYRYQVVVRPGNTVPFAPGRVEPEPSAALPFDPPASGPAAITGLASSAQHCIGSTFRSHVHDLGRIEANNRVTITFESAIDTIAGVALIDVAGRRQVYYSDDNTGGANQPRLLFTAPHGGTMALFVAAANAFPGCYRFKVEVQ